MITLILLRHARDMLKSKAGQVNDFVTRQVKLKGYIIIHNTCKIIKPIDLKDHYLLLNPNVFTSLVTC